MRERGDTTDSEFHRAPNAKKEFCRCTTLGTGLARTGTNRFAKYVEQERRAEAAGFLPPEAKGELRGAPTSYLLVADEITAAAGGEAKLGDFRAVLALLEPRF